MLSCLLRDRYRIKAVLKFQGRWWPTCSVLLSCTGHIARRAIAPLAVLRTENRIQVRGDRDDRRCAQPASQRNGVEEVVDHGGRQSEHRKIKRATRAEVYNSNKISSNDHLDTTAVWLVSAATRLPASAIARVPCFAHNYGVCTTRRDRDATIQPRCSKKSNDHDNSTVR